MVSEYPVGSKGNLKSYVVKPWGRRDKCELKAQLGPFDETIIGRPRWKLSSMDCLL